jgi:hypothetical protein
MDPEKLYRRLYGFFADRLGKPEDGTTEPEEKNNTHKEVGNGGTGRGCIDFSQAGPAQKGTDPVHRRYYRRPAGPGTRQGHPIQRDMEEMDSLGACCTDYRAPLCSLQGIKIHLCEFLYDFALKRNKLLAAAEPRGPLGPEA